MGKLLADVIGNGVIAFFVMLFGMMALSKFIIWFLPWLSAVLY